VCGLRSPEALATAVEAGVDAVGFVFHEPSPRHLSPKAAQALAALVPSHVEKVAVFLHPTQALVDSAVAAVHPDWVQTDHADFAQLRLPPGVRSLPVLRTGVAGDAEEAVRGGGPQRFLLESGRSGRGERADWNTATRVARVAEVVLAGGLDPGNVAAAVAAVRPFGVDVSSGVERERGIKDKALIRDFVEAARAAHARLAGSASEEWQR
jgi:phosphoribosylanthranilate isomerase